MNAQGLTTPKKSIQQLQDQLGHAAKTSNKRRFHALYDKICRLDVLWKAWDQVRKNQGAPGIDRETIADIERQGVKGFLEGVQSQLQRKSYRPLAVRRKYIDKGGGKQRPLGIPAVRDRVVQMAAKIILEPIFEEDFSDSSFGFRPGKSAKQALERVRKACNRKGNWLLDADIQGFFDNINQEKLMLLIKQRVSDRRVLSLLRKWLQAGVMEEGQLRRSDLGVPQGGVISPLLANIYLNYLDFLWDQQGTQWGELTRYADDFVVVCKTRKDAQQALNLVHRIMGRMELTLHPTKTKLVGMWTGKEGFDFLGMHHRKKKATGSRLQVYYTTQQWLTTKAKKRIKDVVKNRLAPPAMRAASLVKHIHYLNPKIQGWRNYYATQYSHRQMIQLDWYIVHCFTKWWASKHQKSRWRSHLKTVAGILKRHGLKTLYAVS